MERVITLVDKLAKSHVLSREEFSFLLDNIGLYCTSISFQLFTSTSSMPVPKIYLVKNENSAISVYSVSTS